MALFRITPGTTIRVTPHQSQYELGEEIWVIVDFSVEAKELSGGLWTIYCEVYIFNKKFTSGGDQKFSPGSTDSGSVSLQVYLGKATTVGTFTGYAAAKAHDGI